MSTTEQLPGSQLPLVASPGFGDVLFGIDGGASGVGGATSKFPVTALMTNATGTLGSYASGLAIGRGYGASGLSTFNGRIQDVAIYSNAVLSPQRIAAHYEAGIA